MPTSAPGSRPGSEICRATTRAWLAARGFTLLELMVVVAIIAIATVGVSLSLRDGGASQLDQEAQRLAALLEAGRAQSRASGAAMVWVSTPDGFAFLGARNDLPRRWLAPGIQTQGAPRILLGPDPLIGPQEVVLQSLDSSGAPVAWRRVATDGLRPFNVQP